MARCPRIGNSFGQIGRALASKLTANRKNWENESVNESAFAGVPNHFYGRAVKKTKKIKKNFWDKNPGILRFFGLYPVGDKVFLNYFLKSA